MPRISITLPIHAPIADVFAIARDVEAFPHFMADLQSITVIDRSPDGNRTTTEWVGLVKQFSMKLKWQQEDIWDPIKYRDDFKAIKGDVKELAGHWQFSEHAGVTTFESVVDYEIDVPLIGPLVKNVIKKLMEHNLRSQMEAIKTKAEEAAA